MNRIKCVFFFFLLSLSFFTKAEVLPLEDFVKHGDYLDFTMSPDGKHFAVRLRQDGEVVLVFIRRADNQIIGGVKPQSSDEVRSVRWVNDSRVVYEISESGAYGGDAPGFTGELFAVNIDGGESQIIYGYRANDSKTGSRISAKENEYATQEVLSVLPNDDQNILIIEYPWEKDGVAWYDRRTRGAVISKLNVYTGRKFKIESLPYNQVTALADDQGNVNFINWQDDKGELHGAFRKESGQAWQEISGALNLYREYLPLAINKDSSKVYLSAAVGERGINTLFELTTASGKIRQLFTGLNSDLTNWVEDPATKEPVIGITYPGKAEYFYAKADSPLVMIHKSLVKAFNGSNVNITGSTRDGKLLVLHIESDINPGEFYVYDTSTKKADLALINRSWIDPLKMHPTKDIEFSSSDGLKIHGYLTLPTLKDNEKAPLVVLIHGGPHYARDYWEYDSEVQLFANRGYAVLQINFRGSGGYGEVFGEAGYHQWGGKMIDDILDGTRWALKNSALDANKVCVYGASYGGYAAMMAAIKGPELYQCAIGYAGIYDLEIMYSKGDISDLWGGEAFLQRVIGRDPEQLKLYSPLYQANKLQAPVMLIHGKKDQRAPIAHAKRLRKALKKLDKNPVWLTFGASGHGVWSVKRQTKLYTEILKFLDLHIGDKRQAGR